MSGAVNHWQPEGDFISRSGAALNDHQLRRALDRASSGFVDKREAAVSGVGNFEAMRERARQVRAKSLADLNLYLRHFESQVQAAGGQVHWAETAQDMRDIVVDLCRSRNARLATKSKSMISEEVDLNAALKSAGIEPLETDLGEYILQLAGERPSHIVAPAVHKSRGDIRKLFETHHALGERDLSEVKAIVDEARTVIRDRYLTADVGITGANMLIAETGTAVVVTNEGNADLTATQPPVHIVLASIEKVVPTWDDASAILRVLGRSATGQAMTTYTSFFAGPGRQAGAESTEFHVILLDNGRSDLLDSEYREMLHCIRCGACMNHCPVYQAVGGHAYGSVYPGPMGAVLTPLLRGNRDDYQLANASTFCGRCEAVCPVKIPLPGLMRKLRNREKRQHGNKLDTRLVRLFCRLAARPRLYRRLTALGVALLSRLSGHRGGFSRLPLLGRWTRYRDFPAPPGGTFQAQYRNSAAGARPGDKP
jgi:L-lactate dehydrogenase complex protein LldF